nr:B3 DNA binding domain-containing protein [Tanacetum cinerariifolium]
MGIASTEMELILEQTQQGISHEVSKDSILQAGNPVKEILLKLNLPDHRKHKDGGEAGDTNPTPPPLQNSDQPPFLYLSDSADNNFTISQLNPNPNPSPNPNPNPNPNPPIYSPTNKRRKTKPVRFGGPTVIEPVVPDSSSNKSRSPKENSDAKSPAEIRAEEVQASLGKESPSCVKLIAKVHVDPGYWMGFLRPFAKTYLPKKDCEMLVEDENRVIEKIKYNADKLGLSAGWKRFTSGHNLVEGDAIVFHLVEPNKFKVYIIRADNLNEVNGALCLLNMEEQMIPEMDMPSLKTKERKRPKSLPLLEQYRNNSEEVGPEVLEGSRTSKPELSLEELKTIEDFHIMVKGVCIDSELPDDVTMNYYKLCVARKELLHDELAEGLNEKLVAGMIGETVNIANKIKNCQISTTKGEFEAWDNHLKSFGILGMKVEFLRERIPALSRIVSESEEKLVGLKESSRKFKRTIDGLKEKIEVHEEKLKKQLNAFKIV